MNSDARGRDPSRHNEFGKRKHSNEGWRRISRAADVVLLVDHLDRLLPGIEIAQRSRRIALESVAAGIGLSIIGMIAAEMGYLTPVQGALAQEVIDRRGYLERPQGPQDRAAKCRADRG